MLELPGMAKSFATSLLVCLCLLLASCGQARIVRRDYPDEPVSAARPLAAAPTPSSSSSASASHSARPAPPTATKPVAPTPVTPEPIPASQTYIVKAGDTLYGIARRFGLKFSDIVGWNKLAEPYAIQSGQRLHLHAPATEYTAASAADASKADAAKPAPVFTDVPPVVAEPGPASASTTSVAATTEAPKPAPIDTTVHPAPSTPAPPVVSNPVSGAQLPPAPKPLNNVPPPKPVPVETPAPVVVPPAAQTAPAPNAPSGVAVAGGPSWRWPTEGDIVGRYVSGDQTQQGIDIAGRSGQPVIAAADGVVVYSGAGLVGYGELVIIKHSDEWLSAYAHNRRRLVAEGTKVKAGEAIAEMGRTGAVSDMLHFEIRRNGKPVDPLLYLPKR